MKNIKIYFIFLVFLMKTGLIAQQLPLFTQYRENKPILNPAAISMDFIKNGYTTSVSTTARTQWIGLDRNPQTQILRGDHIFNGDAVSMQTGLHIINDQTGPTGFAGAYVRVAGIVGNTDEGGFSAGLNAGLVQFRIDGAQIEFNDPTDALAQRDYRKLYPDVGIGLFAYKILNNQGFFKGDIAYAGFSMPQTFGLDLLFREDNKNFNLKRLPHYYALAGYHKTLYDEAFLEGSVWVRHVKNTPFQADFNLKYQINSAFSIGTGFSTNNTLHAEIGFILGENTGLSNQLVKIGYGFDAPFNGIAPHFGTAHEVSISTAF